MKYINILFIILLVIIISYILIYYIKYYKTEQFEGAVQQLIDNDFSILSIDSKLEYKGCDNNECNIKFFDKVINSEGIKSIYYVTDDDIIYILNTIIGIKKSEIIDTDKSIITSIHFSNDLKYGFVGTKSRSTKRVNIFYTTNTGTSWKRLLFKYENINTFKEEIKNENNLYSIDFLLEKNYIIDNIIVKYDNLDMPESISFSTFGVLTTTAEEEETHSTECTLRTIYLSSTDKNFKQYESENFIYSAYYNKYYRNDNIIREDLLYKKIHKILNHNNGFFILVNNFQMEYYDVPSSSVEMEEKLGDYEKLRLEIYRKTRDNTLLSGIVKNLDSKLIHINNEMHENLFTRLNNIIEIKKYSINNVTTPDKYKNFLLCQLKITTSNSNISIISCPLDNTGYNSERIYEKKILFDEYSSSTIVTTSGSNIEYITGDKNIKDYDLDIIYAGGDSESISNRNTNIGLMLYYVNNLNELYKSQLNYQNLNIPMVAGNPILIEYPIDTIKFITKIFLHPKLSYEEELTLFVQNQKKIFFNYQNDWKEINSYRVEFNTFNRAQFVDSIEDTHYIIFDGDNTLSKHKVYTIEFKIDKYVDILMVGAGGGGGFGGGGGGGGDIKLLKNIKMPAGKYRIIVGCGGKGGVSELDDLGYYGNNTEIELIEGEGIFVKKVVAGGGGGGSLSRNATSTPVNNKLLGDINYSSGGGGGGGGQRGLGGIGNGVSGNGGSSIYIGGIVYGGGGGSGGISNIFNTDMIKGYNNGENASNESLGIGGYSINIIAKYITTGIFSISGGGHGGFYGEVDSSNIGDILNKTNILYPNLDIFDKEINLNEQIESYNLNNRGKGGNGSFIPTNENLNIITIGTKGNTGVLIIYGSRLITRDEEPDDTESDYLRDKLMNLYKLKGRDIVGETHEYNEASAQSMVERAQLKNNWVFSEEHPTERNKNEKNRSPYRLENESDKVKMEYKKSTKIIDPISNAFLPYSSTENKDIELTDPQYNINRYNIIKLYKDLLHRQPTNVELNDYNRKMINNLTDLTKIRRHIINSDEYTRVIKLQSNETNQNLIYADARKNIYSIIAELYLLEVKEEIPNALLGPLTDVYYYLQYNEYLFRAMLVHINFNNFKNELIEDKTSIVRNDIIDIWKQYFVITDIRNSANGIQRYDKFHKQDPVTTDSELPDLSQVILEDTFEYSSIWDAETEDVNATQFQEELNQLEDLRNKIDDEMPKLALQEEFTNYTKLSKSNERFSEGKLPRVSTATYQYMTDQFTNKVNF